MPIFRSAHYSGKRVAALTTDLNSGQYLWIAFEKDSTDNCRILKVSAQDLNQIYFDVDIEVDAIKKLLVNSTSLYVGVDDPVNYIYKFSVANPLIAPTIIALPAGVAEAPVDVVDDGAGYFWWLFPGLSGEITKIVKTTNTGTFQQTITLQQSAVEVHNAASIVYRSGDLWVVTNESPANLVRVHLVSGVWTFNVTPLVTT